MIWYQFRRHFDLHAFYCPTQLTRTRTHIHIYHSPISRICQFYSFWFNCFTLTFSPHIHKRVSNKYSDGNFKFNLKLYLYTVHTVERLFCIHKFITNTHEQLARFPDWQYFNESTKCNANFLWRRRETKTNTANYMYKRSHWNCLKTAQKLCNQI